MNRHSCNLPHLSLASKMDALEAAYFRRPHLFLYVHADTNLFRGNQP